MTQETAVQVLCDKDDKNLDTIAMRLAAIIKAAESNTLVAISCKDGEASKDVIVLAVMTKNDDEESAEYAPIGELYYPQDMSFTKLTPPSTALGTASASEEDISG